MKLPWTARFPAHPALFSASCSTLIFALACAGAPGSSARGAADSAPAPAAEQDPGPGASAQTAPPTSSRSGAAASGDLSPAETSTPAAGQSAAAPLPLPEGSKVLQVGDSFAGALGIPLGKLLEARGVRSILKHKDASYLTTWAWEGDLQELIWKYNPDLVVVTVGANELEISQPEKRERTVRKITSIIGERPCLWVAIPLWKGEQNGLMEVIRRSVAPCVYYDTNELIDVAHMPRIHDGIHPTASAREQWARAVLEWMAAHRRPEGDRVWNLAP